MKKHHVVAVSGGMDSATLLAIVLNEQCSINDTVHAITFEYGSKHNQYEQKCAHKLINFYQDKYQNLLYHGVLDLSYVFSNLSIRSNLMKTGGAIPEGHYAEESMKKTVVPGRNTIFFSLMLGLCESYVNNETEPAMGLVYAGVHSGDHHIYPDCRAPYIAMLNETFNAATEGKVLVKAPLLQMDKTSILHDGFKLGVPYHLTRTCYKDQEKSCGKCGSCQERLEAFRNIGVADPIEYEEV